MLGQPGAEGAFPRRGLDRFGVPGAGLRGTRPALAGKLGQGTAFALRARE